MFTAAQARLKPNECLQVLGPRVLSYDTDSVFCLLYAVVLYSGVKPSTASFAEGADLVARVSATR